MVKRNTAKHRIASRSMVICWILIFALYAFTLADQYYNDTHNTISKSIAFGIIIFWPAALIITCLVLGIMYKTTWLYPIVCFIMTFIALVPAALIFMDSCTDGVLPGSGAACFRLAGSFVLDFSYYPLIDLLKYTVTYIPVIFVPYGLGRLIRLIREKSGRKG